ncbi:Hypothetical protein FKW44_018663, partial [Caligus rogercresseyi]
IRASAKLDCRYIGGFSRTNTNYTENATLTTNLHNDAITTDVEHSDSYMVDVKDRYPMGRR